MKRPTSFNPFNCLMLFVLVIWQGCDKAHQDPILADYFKNQPVFSLKGEPIEVVESDSSFFGKITEMVYVDELLIIRDVDQNYRMKLVNLNSNTMVKFGKRGEGPNELIGEFNRASVDYLNNRVYLSDFPFYHLYSVDSLKNGRSLEPTKN